MRNYRRMWLGSRAALALLAVWLLAPATADAQQPLFPNMTANNRQRVPCCNENPLYHVYRQQYYGYYPTAWRKFPNGWGYPSPELANVAKGMEDIKRDLKKQEEEKKTGENEEEGALPGAPGTKPPGAEGNVPLPPEGTSPFDMPAKPPAGGAAAPETPPAPPPPGTPAARPAAANAPEDARLSDRHTPPADAGSLPPLDVEDAPAPAANTNTADTSGDALPHRRSMIGGLFDNLHILRR